MRSRTSSKQRDPFAAAGEPQFCDRRSARHLDARVETRQASQIPIMKDHRPTVRTHLHVDLDGKAVLKGRLYRNERIFGTLSSWRPRWAMGRATSQAGAGTA